MKSQNIPVQMTGIELADYKRTQNKLRRRRERSRNMKVSIFTLLLALLLAIAFGSFFSKAASIEEDSILYKYYTNICVESGDTLWGISEQYRNPKLQSQAAYIQEVRYINHKKEDTLQIGEYLIIPYYDTTFKN